MMDFQKYFLLFLNFLTKVIGYIPAAIYSYVYSEFFTKVTYRMIGERNKQFKDINNVIDIGTATGGPLSTIVDNFKEARILGIDYNKLYIPACKKLFEKHPNVEIKYMDFYDLDKEEPDTLFDIIIFGSSFMILPDQTKAIEIATRKLSKHGRIYFLLTLYDQKTLLNKVMEYVKPSLKYLCTVDFGKVTYKNQFQSFLQGHDLRITMNDRCYGNFFLSIMKFYIYEAQKV